MCEYIILTWSLIKKKTEVGTQKQLNLFWVFLLLGIICLFYILFCVEDKSNGKLLLYKRQIDLQINFNTNLTYDSDL